VPKNRECRGRLTWALLLAGAGCANGGDPYVGSSGDTSPEAASPEGGADAKPAHDAADASEAGVGTDAVADVVAPYVDSSAPETSVPDATPVDANDDSPVVLPSPIGAWSFDEGTGATSADLSGNGHPATLMGSASWTTAGKKGAGLALDGVSGYADVGMTLVATTGSFTVMTWASFAVVGPWQVAVSEDDATGSLFGLKLRGDASSQFDFDAELTDAQNPAFVVAQSTSLAQATTWVHLTGVHDASGSGAMKTYVNGVLQANAAVGQTLLGATGHFLIGRGLYDGVAGSFLDGTVDEVAVYGSALTDAQVAAIYDAQK
jgi:Concanavalin A-like lectin/glucanases superfamily